MEGIKITLMKTKYVAGLLFNKNKTEVALIRKNRPGWQAGKLNAIGGKLEEGESPLDAMIREFSEETGIYHSDWRLFTVLTGESFEVNFFVGYADYLSRLISMTDEKVEVWTLNEVPNMEDKISNLNWLIPLALDKDKVFAVVKDFKPNE